VPARLEFLAGNNPPGSATVHHSTHLTGNEGVRLVEMLASTCGHAKWSSANASGLVVDWLDHHFTCSEAGERITRAEGSPFALQILLARCGSPTCVPLLCTHVLVTGLAVDAHWPCFAAPVSTYSPLGHRSRCLRVMCVSATWPLHHASTTARRLVVPVEPVEPVEGGEGELRPTPATAFAAAFSRVQVCRYFG